jgi:hypothetical protein
MALATAKLLRAVQFSLAGALVAGAAVAWCAKPAAAAPDNGASQLMANKTITGTVMDGTSPAANTAVKLITKSKTSGPVRRGPNDSPTGDANVGNPEADRLQNAPGGVAKGEHVVQSTNTDAQGKFTFANVAPGNYEVMAGTGNKATRMTVNVKDGVDIPPLTINLKK